MADVVQFKLERMSNELDDLEKRGLFTRSELSEIVKQRRRYEYRLKRPSPLKQDFLSYIEYEKRVDALRHLRKKALRRESGKKMTKGVSDYAGVSRILEIYRLAVTRFKDDLEIWFGYLEFCKERRNGRMKKVLAQVIRYHPKVPAVWIYAAAWQFDHNLNVSAARALMQSGLRTFPGSEDLWVEYLRMELTYLNKLKARKVALGEDEGALILDYRDANEDQWKEENSDLFMSLDEGPDANSADLEKTDSKKPDLFQKQGLDILRTIYSGAVEALPSSFNLRKRLFEILEPVNLAQSDELRKEILNDMKRVFSMDPEFWDWRAKIETSNHRASPKTSEGRIDAQLQKAIQIYEEALDTVPSELMFKLYASFLMNAILSEKNSGLRNDVSSSSIDYVSCLLTVYEKAQTMGCLTEDLACEHVSFYLQLGRLEKARGLAENLCAGKLSGAVQLWLLRVSVEMRCVSSKAASPSEADLSSIFELLGKVLRNVSISAAEGLWLMALKFFANRKNYFNKLVEISLVSLAKEGGSENGFSLSSTIVNFALQDGIKHARSMYKRFLALPHPGITLYKTCIELETNLASTGDKDCLVIARKLYESAIAAYDQDANLWRDYYKLEVKLGTTETASAIYWRARKTLHDTSGFTVASEL